MKISALICLLLALSGISAGESRIGQQGLSPDYVDPNGRFEKLMVYGKTLKMGFKRVDFLPGGLPGKIRVYQHDILAAPVELEMVINGKMQSGTKRVSLRKNGKNAAVAVGTQKIDGASPLRAIPRRARENSWASSL